MNTVSQKEYNVGAFWGLRLLKTVGMKKTVLNSKESHLEESHTGQGCKYFHLDSYLERLLKVLILH